MPVARRRLKFTIGDVDGNPATLIVTATSSNQALVPEANLTLGGSGATRTIAATPLTAARGETTITITVSDGADSGAIVTDILVFYARVLVILGPYRRRALSA